MPDEERQLYRKMFKHFCLIIARRERIENFWKFYIMIELNYYLQRDIGMCAEIVCTFSEPLIARTFFIVNPRKGIRKLLC